MCLCGYRNTLYDAVYQHQQHGGCKQDATKIYEVDRDSYSDFLRHVEWRLTQPFGNCVPISDKNGQHINTQQPLRGERKPVKK